MKAILSVLIAAGAVAFIALTQNAGWLKAAFIAMVQADGTTNQEAAEKAWRRAEGQISSPQTQGGWAVIKVTTKSELLLCVESLFSDRREDRQEGAVAISKEAELVIRRPANGDDHTIEIAAGWEKHSNNGKVLPPPCRALLHFNPEPHLELIGGSSVVSESGDSWVIAAKNEQPFELNIAVQWE